MDHYLNVKFSLGNNGELSDQFILIINERLFVSI